MHPPNLITATLSHVVFRLYDHSTSFLSSVALLTHRQLLEQVLFISHVVVFLFIIYFLHVLVSSLDRVAHVALLCFLACLFLHFSRAFLLCFCCAVKHFLSVYFFPVNFSGPFVPAFLLSPVLLHVV